MIGGKLQSYLRASRAEHSYGNLHGISNSLSPRDLTIFALQVARGMDFLSKNGVRVPSGKIFNYCLYCLVRWKKVKNLSIADDQLDDLLVSKTSTPKIILLIVFEVCTPVYILYQFISFKSPLGRKALVLKISVSQLFQELIFFFCSTDNSQRFGSQKYSYWREQSMQSCRFWICSRYRQ